MVFFRPIKVLLAVQDIPKFRCEEGKFQKTRYHYHFPALILNSFQMWKTMNFDD